MSFFQTKNSFEHVDRLAYEIGPRLAGSEGERRAANYISQYLEDCGLSVRKQKLQFVNKVARVKATAAILTGIFIASILLPSDLAVVTTIAGASFILALSHVMSKSSSQNVIGSLKPEGEPKRRIVLSAHYDSAPCTKDPRWIIYLKFALPALLTILLILSILRFLNLTPGWQIAFSILGIFLLPTCFISFRAHTGFVSPGADDNASGVAVMLEAARSASDSPPEGSELWFVAFGGREHGLSGSKEFASRSAKPTTLINLDSLGAGDHLSIVQGNGTLRKLRSSSQLNEKIRKTARKLGLELKSLWTPFSSYDHSPLVKNGVNATTLTSKESRRKSRLERFLEKALGLSDVETIPRSEVHALEDVPEDIRLENMGRAGLLSLELLGLESD